MILFYVAASFVSVIVWKKLWRSQNDANQALMSKTFYTLWASQSIGIVENIVKMNGKHQPIFYAAVRGPFDSVMLMVLNDSQRCILMVQHTFPASKCQRFLISHDAKYEWMRVKLQNELSGQIPMIHTHDYHFTFGCDLIEMALARKSSVRRTHLWL